MYTNNLTTPQIDGLDTVIKKNINVTINIFNIILSSLVL